MNFQIGELLLHPLGDRLVLLPILRNCILFMFDLGNFHLLSCRIMQRKKQRCQSLFSKMVSGLITRNSSNKINKRNKINQINYRNQKVSPFQSKGLTLNKPDQPCTLVF